MQRLFLVKILSAEGVHNLVRGNLPLLFGNCLDDVGKLPVHGFGQLESKISVHNKGHPSLAGLGIDPHDGFVFPSDVGRIDGQIGNLPDVALSFLHGVHAFVDGILV